ncbi:MAG: UDP-N-acetylmuramoyl-L-alanine--D-glutamate ligase [Chloroflexota bacterium]
MSSLTFKDKRILVMGLGVHGGGVGVAKFFAKHGARVTVTDLKTPDELGESLKQLNGLPIEYVLGAHRELDFVNCDIVIRNPAVPRDNPFLQLARARGIPVEMEISLFCQLCPAPIIGITGTKGKTTTTLLTGTMLKEKDARTVIAGNLRVSALELLDQIDATTPVVLELSSWQCEGLEAHQFSPRMAAITNLHPDHLNRYKDMAEYAAAKALIFQNQKPNDVLVLNADQKISREFAGQARSRVVWFSRTQRVDGVYLRGDDITLGGDAVLDGAWVTLPPQRIAQRSDVHLLGEHNLENVLAATALALAAGVTPSQIQNALCNFMGVPHRLELVRELNGVRYINDTTSTAPAAAIAALKAVGHDIILIAGGADKALDFEALGRSASLRAKNILLLDGDAYFRLDDMIRYGGGGNKIVGRFTTLSDAINKAHELAQPGDTVLLSPGCASFGMFQNEFERGEQFRKMVMAL